MCITFCLVYHSDGPRTALVYEHARLKTSIASFLFSLLLISVLTFLIYSFTQKPLWSVYPVQNAILVHFQIYLMMGLLMSTLTIFLSTLFFRFFVGVLIAATTITVLSPILSLLFLVHLFFKLHIFYILASKITCEVTILFIFFYQGYERDINDEIEENG
ncbi:uncharacterized protein LOC113465471 [Diaphorina citri]|uniref:Uncharacterized protein LOC113465471 n=1 Tax=Diaphorina citri TaxID=121845 RepID=A0A3Q0IHX4_DIACI|nr:uncharacterized protein LOC113465471 [Diaphorina citri]KAI5747769.1 hypothetical protein M8J77_018341 [Diaphorina citri]